jgi:dolichol-phosphate mannosyltransferase
VNHRARRFGVSKYGLNRILKVILDLMVVKFLFQYLTKPIYVFGGFGLFSLFLAFASFGWALYYKLAGLKDFISTPLPLVCALFTMVGCLSILMGLVAEVLVRTYYESQGKRPYILASVIDTRHPADPPAAAVGE